jgi:hypothetical protein
VQILIKCKTLNIKTQHICFKYIIFKLCFFIYVRIKLSFEIKKKINYVPYPTRSFRVDIYILCFSFPFEYLFKETIININSLLITKERNGL